MKHTVMLRVLDTAEPFKKLVEIDFNKFQFKWRMPREVIGTIDGIQVAMCINDYDKIKTSYDNGSTTEDISRNQ